MLFFLLIRANVGALTPQRVWLERLAFAVPGPGASRWLLCADAICLTALGMRTRWPALGVPLALGVGFLALNVIGMVVTDFYLGLAAFHLLVAIVTLALVPRRWLGAGALVLALLLGMLT